MEEVYWGCFERVAEEDRRSQRPLMLSARTTEAVSPPAEVELPADWTNLLEASAASGRAAWAGGERVRAVGSGFNAYPQLLARLGPQLAAVQPELRPRAREIVELAAQKGLAEAIAPEHAQPVYLRDRVTTRS